MPVDFLKAIHGDEPRVLVAIKPDGGKRDIEARTFRSSEDPSDWIAKYDELGWNLYHQPNPPLKPKRKKLAKTDVKCVRVLHVDVDARVEDPKGKSLEQLQAELSDERTRIKRLFTEELPEGVPKPTALIMSGNGYQALWALDEPIEVGGDEARCEDVKRYNKQLATLLGGDKCFDVCHLLRLPGTLNIPNKKKRDRGRVKTQSELVWCEPDRRYKLTEFKAASNGKHPHRGSVSVNTTDLERVMNMDELDKWGVPDRVKVIIVQGCYPDEPKKDDNSRSAWLFDCCCQLVRANVPDDVIFSLITDPDYDISASVLDKGANADRYATRQIERAKEEVEHPELAELNAKFAIIGNYGGKCCVVEEYDARDAESASYGVQSRDHFAARFAHRHVPVGDKKTEPLGRWWLKHRHARRYERVVFAPDGRVADNVLNLWRGFAVEPAEGDCGLFLEHIRDNVCAGNEQHAEWLISWMARAVQEPSVAAEIAVVLRGARGVGKTFFAEEFGALFGRHFLAIANARHLVGNFNVHLEDCLVLLADEAFFAGDKRHASVLKSLITGSKIPVERKGYDLRTARNHLHLIMCSNDAWVVPAGLDERRFFVLDVAPSHQRDTDYFGRVARQLEDGGYAALLHFLLNRNISEWDFRKAPDTKSLLDQKILSLAPVQRAVYEMLCTGAHPRSLVDGERVFVVTEDLARDIGQKAVKARGVAFELKAITDGQVREVIGEERRRGFWMPPLAEARDRWATTHGLDGVRWPDDVTQWDAAEEPSDDDLPF